MEIEAQEDTAERRSILQTVAPFGGFCLVWAVIAMVVLLRVHVPHWVYPLFYVALFGVGLLVDLKWNGFKERPLLRRAVIEPSLLLLCLVPMLSFLFSVWAGQLQSTFLTGGLLPSGDAAAWSSAVKLFMATGELNLIAGNRPLGTCMIASALALTDQNYQLALILLVWFAGIATFLAARETWRAGGMAAAILFIFLASISMAPWLPLLMTMTPGYIFGCLGYTYLLRGSRVSSFPRSLCGLALLTVAMMARPGAVMVVPLLAIYVFYFFTRGKLRDFFLKATATVAVCAAAIGLSLLMRSAVAPAEAESHGNTPFMLYALASGGEKWDHAFSVHPELSELESFGEKHRAAWVLFRKRLAADPLLFVGTIARLSATSAVLFPDVFFPTFRPLPTEIPGTLCLVALVLLLRPAWRRRGAWSFLVPGALGILLSTPFVPEGSLRYFAPAYPLAAGLAAAAIALLTEWGRKIVVESDAESVVLSWEREDGTAVASDPRSRFPAVALPAFSVIVVAAVSVLPLALSVRADLPPLPAPVRTSKGMWREIVFYHHPRSGILIAEKSRLGKMVESSPEQFLRPSGLTQQLNLNAVIHPGVYVCDVLTLGNPGSYYLYLIFPEAIRGKAGYFKATLRGLGSAEKPLRNLYLVEDFKRL